MDLIDRQQRQVQQSRTNGLKNMYRLLQGEIVDYMVDYDDDKFKLGVHGLQTREKTNIHSDSIGEYKSEFIKIVFEQGKNTPE